MNKPYENNTAETDKADYEYIMARCAPLDMLSTVVLKDIICELQNEIDDRPDEVTAAEEGDSESYETIANAENYVINKQELRGM